MPGTVLSVNTHYPSRFTFSEVFRSQGVRLFCFTNEEAKLRELKGLAQGQRALSWSQLRLRLSKRSSEISANTTPFHAAPGLGCCACQREREIPQHSPDLWAEGLGKAAEGLGTEHTTHCSFLLTEGCNLGPRQESLKLERTSDSRPGFLNRRGSRERRECQGGVLEKNSDNSSPRERRPSPIPYFYPWGS